VNEEQERASRHKTELLAGLPRLEAFQLLEKELLRKQRSMADAFWAVLMSDHPPLDMGEQTAFVRGFFRGMRYAIALPKAHENKRNGEVEIEDEEIEDRWSAWVAK